MTKRKCRLVRPSERAKLDDPEAITSQANQWEAARTFTVDAVSCSYLKTNHHPNPVCRTRARNPEFLSSVVLALPPPTFFLAPLFPCQRYLFPTVLSGPAPLCTFACSVLFCLVLFCPHASITPGAQFYLPTCFPSMSIDCLFLFFDLSVRRDAVGSDGQ